MVIACTFTKAWRIPFHLYVEVERLKSHDLRVAEHPRLFQAFHRMYNPSALLCTPESQPLRLLESHL